MERWGGKGSVLDLVERFDASFFVPRLVAPHDYAWDDREVTLRRDQQHEPQSRKQCSVRLVSNFVVV